MADTRYVRFRYGPTVHTVAMYPGLPSEEFTMILKALLPVQVQGNIIGLQGEQGEVVPITLSCRSPEVLRDSTYVLLVSGDTSTPSSHVQRSNLVLPSAPPLTSVQQDNVEEEEYHANIAPPAPPLKPSTNPVYDDELTADDAQEEDNTMDELLRFIAGLRVKRIINKTESDSLEELLFSNSSLVLAAYSVAKSAGDSQYLANICKDIAQSMMTTAGQSACAAQEEVLQCCDHLYLSRKITDNQLLYLRHLVLIREEEVAEVYDEFQVHRDLDRMFRELHRIANTHPKNPESEDDDEEDDEDDEDDEEEETDKAEMVASPAFATTLGGVLSLMHRAQLVTAGEAMLLNHMIATENEFLLAAHELFVHDGDINELQDTMIRCAKLVSRRMNERQEYKEEDDIEEDENIEGSEDPEDNSKSQLDEILEAVGVKNSWSATVPSRFILAVFAAAQKDLLAVGQARALCDLYQAKYDLVRAAWEVYNVQGDVVDFTDTLRRIVRDLNFRDDGNVQVTSSDQQARDVFSAVKESKDRTEAAYNNKQEAVLAVAEAKQELLRHSLEMMVKQEIIAAAAAQSLYERAAHGDPLTDAAIEAYASDRNIMEFLDTLQILANNTPEEINRIMRSAIDEDGDESESDENPFGSNEESASDEKTDEYDDSDFEDDDDEDGNGKELDMAQKKLYEVVLELVEEDMINSGTATILMTLINSRDDRVMAAFDVYSEYEDKDDLVDSLLRVARKELQQYLTARSAQEDDGIEMSSLKKDRQAAEDARYVEVEMTQMKNDRDEDGEDNDEVDDESDEGDEGAQVGLLNSGDQISILDILSKAGAIETHHAERIIKLINANDVDIQQIFLEYERKKDVYRLIENLRFFIGESDSEDTGDMDDDEEDQDDEDEDSESIEARFLNIIQEMNLSHLETAALRLAIARDDFAIRSALEMFRVSRDEAELIETLRNVAKKTIDTTLTEAGYDGIQEDDVDEDTEDAAGDDEDDDDEVENDDDENDDDENDDDENDEDEEEEGGENVDGQSDEDSDEDEEEEDEDEEGDERAEADDNEEGGLMSTQSAREYIFPILLSELVKENVLGENDGEVLKQLFSNGDAVVNAALDVYDLDSDMAELVDTLQKVVRSQ